VSVRKKAFSLDVTDSARIIHGREPFQEFDNAARGQRVGADPGLRYLQHLRGKDLRALDAEAPMFFSSCCPEAGLQRS
jgi:hypothetical protein